MQLSILLTQEETEIFEEGDLQTNEYQNLKEKIRQLYCQIDREDVPVLGKDEDGELYDICLYLDRFLR